MQTLNFIEVLDRIVTQDPRYQRDAYFFVREALDFTQKQITKSNKNEIRHVTGQELLSGIRDYALTQFGPMTQSVFAQWGVRHCSDFGEIVFNMVEARLLSKTDSDSPDDFKNGYTFEDAFTKPFLPKSKLAQPNPVPKPAQS